MKELADGTTVTSRGFYFLLDWNDRNDKQVMTGLYNIWKLQDLTQHQYLYMMKHAMADELNLIENAAHEQHQ